LGSPAAKPKIRYRLDNQRITGAQPLTATFFKKRSGTPSVPKLRNFLLATSFATRFRALLGARPRRTGAGITQAQPPRHPSHMTLEDVEDVVRALTMVVENLEASAAKQSMLEAFTQVRVYADERRHREPNRRAKID
jgi:hypothetical protein